MVPEIPAGGFGPNWLTVLVGTESVEAIFRAFGSRAVWESNAASATVIDETKGFVGIAGGDVNVSACVAAGRGNPPTLPLSHGDGG